MAAKRIPPAKLAHIVPELRQLAVPIADLVPDPVNAKGHPPEQVKAIAASFREFKQDQPIVVQREGMIVRKGNGRLLGAREAGYEYLAAIVVDESETRAVARALADNRLSEMGTWDHRRLGELLGKVRDAHDVDVSVTGYDEGLIRKFLARAASIQTGVDPDTVPAAPAVPVSIRGDLWLLGEHRLLCGDATNKDDVERVCFGRNPFLMVTDPPYGVDYNPEWRQEAADKGEIGFGAKRLGKVQNDDRANWTSAWELFKGPVAYVWHAATRSLIVGNDLQSSGFSIRSVLIWRKPSFAISRGHYHWQHESCFYVVRKGESAKWAGDRSQSTVWDMATVNMSGANPDDAQTDHGTQKPVEAMARPMRNHGEANDDVYDPFAGSGSSIIAAEGLNRRCCALEIEPTYSDVIVERWQNFAGKDATHEATGKTFAEIKAERLKPKGGKRGGRKART